MKIVGYLLIIVGFICGALIGTYNKEIINWYYFIPSLFVGALGVIILRRGMHRHTKGEDKIGSDIKNIETSLNNIVEKINTFNREKESVGVYDIHEKIDTLFIDDINTFVEARKSIIHRFNMQSYADLMNHFAAAERYLNRSWSASADGYIDESYAYIAKAVEQFEVTKQHFDKLSLM
jgi:hypothetical protein